MGAIKRVLLFTELVLCLTLVSGRQPEVRVKGLEIYSDGEDEFEDRLTGAPIITIYCYSTTNPEFYILGRIEQVNKPNEWFQSDTLLGEWTRELGNTINCEAWECDNYLIGCASIASALPKLKLGDDFFGTSRVKADDFTLEPRQRYTLYSWDVLMATIELECDLCYQMEASTYLTRSGDSGSAQPQDGSSTPSSAKDKDSDMDLVTFLETRIPAFIAGVGLTIFIGGLVALFVIRRRKSRDMPRVALGVPLRQSLAPMLAIASVVEYPPVDQPQPTLQISVPAPPLLAPMPPPSIPTSSSMDNLLNANQGDPPSEEDNRMPECPMARAGAPITGAGSRPQSRVPGSRTNAPNLRLPRMSHRPSLQEPVLHPHSLHASELAPHDHEDQNSNDLLLEEEAAALAAQESALELSQQVVQTPMVMSDPSREQAHSRTWSSDGGRALRGSSGLLEECRMRVALSSSMEALPPVSTSDNMDPARSLSSDPATRNDWLQDAESEVEGRSAWGCRVDVMNI